MGIFGTIIGLSDPRALVSLIPLIYSTLIFIKLKRNTEFEKTHKFTVISLVLFSLFAGFLSLIFLSFLKVTASGDGVGWYGIIGLEILLTYASTLSFLIYIVESIVHKKF